MNHKFQQYLKNSNSLVKYNKDNSQYKYLFDLISCKCVCDTEDIKINDECPHFYLRDFFTDCQSLIMNYFESINIDMLIKNIPHRYTTLRSIITNNCDGGYKFFIPYSPEYESKKWTSDKMLLGYITEIDKRISRGLDIMYSKNRIDGFSIHLGDDKCIGDVKMCIGDGKRIYHICINNVDIAILICNDDKKTLVVPTNRYFSKYKKYSIYKRWLYLKEIEGSGCKLLHEDSDIFDVFSVRNKKLYKNEKSFASFSKGKILIRNFSPIISFCLYIILHNH